MEFLVNPHQAPDAVHIHPALDAAAARSATELLAQCFDYQPTRLVSLGATAARCGLAAIHLKDEGARLGLKSFKAPPSTSRTRVRAWGARASRPWAAHMP